MKRHILGTDNKSIFEEQEILISFSLGQVVKKNGKADQISTPASELDSFPIDRDLKGSHIKRGHFNSVHMTKEHYFISESDTAPA